MKIARDEEGSKTTIAWIHSHVDEEDRQDDANGKMTCACRTGGEDRCNPEHEHHVGNEEADREAKKGATKPKSGVRADAAKGEMWHMLHGETDFAQGSYKEWLRDKEEAAWLDIAPVQEPDSEYDDEEVAGTTWKDAVMGADKKLRRAMMKTLDRKEHTSWRFWSRLLCKCLPTNAQMMRYALGSAENTYRSLYVGRIGEHGKCVSCECECETVEHAVWACPKAEMTWQQANDEIGHMWDEKHMDWGREGWLEHPDKWGAWERMWGIAGLVPRDAIDRAMESTGSDYISAYTLMRDTARIVLRTAQTVWKLRVEATLEWEKGAGAEGLGEAKTAMRRRQWRRNEPRKARKRKDPAATERIRLERTSIRESGERAREQQGRMSRAEDNKRHKQGRVPVREAQSQGAADSWARAAEKQRSLAIARENGRRAVATRNNMDEITMVNMDTTEVQLQRARQVSVTRQEGQKGIWFPAVDQAVQQWGVKDSEGKETYTQGHLTETDWRQDESPRFRVQWPTEEAKWYDTVKHAGYDIRPVLQADLNNAPRETIELLGHGSQVITNWTGKSTKQTEEYVGRVVALRGGDELAVRYGTASTRSVAWHTVDDLQDRGCTVITARRGTDMTNEQYQGEAANMAAGCLLLTDCSQCECGWCTRTGWPAEVVNAAELGIPTQGLAEMGPREGRREVLKRDTRMRMTRAQRTTVDQREQRKIQRIKQAGEAVAAKRKRAAEATERNEQAARGQRNQGADEEASGGTQEGTHDPGGPEAARASSGQKQSRREGNRPRTRSQGVGLAGSSPWKGVGDPQVDHRVEQRVDHDGSAQDTRAQGRGSVVAIGRSAPRGLGTGRQGGSSGGGEGVDGKERGTGEGRLPSAEDREKRVPADSEGEHLQESGRNRSHVRCDSHPDREGRDGDGDRQAACGAEGPRLRVGQRVGQVGSQQGVDTDGDPADGRGENNDKTGGDEGGKGAQRGIGRAQNTGCGGGLGIDRDCSGSDARGLLNDRTGQGEDAVPRGPARTDNEQAKHGSVHGGDKERAEESGEAHLQEPGIVHPGMALPRVQDPHSSKQHERRKRNCKRGAYQRGSEHRSYEQRGPGPEEGGAEAVSPGSGEPTQGAGGGEHRSEVRDGEPEEERPLGHAVSAAAAVKERAGMEARGSGPVRIWTQVPEANEDSDEPEGLEASGDDGDWKMQGEEVWGHEEQPPRRGTGETRAADDHIRPSKKAEGGGGDGGRDAQRVQCASGQEPGSGGAGPRDRAGGSPGGEEEEEVTGHQHRSRGRQARGLGTSSQNTVPIGNRIEQSKGVSKKSIGKRVKSLTGTKVRVKSKYIQKVMTVSQKVTTVSTHLAVDTATDEADRTEAREAGRETERLPSDTGGTQREPGGRARRDPAENSHHEGELGRDVRKRGRGERGGADAEGGAAGHPHDAEVAESRPARQKASGGGQREPAVGVAVGAGGAGRGTETVCALDRGVAGSGHRVGEGEDSGGHYSGDANSGEGGSENETAGDQRDGQGAGDGPGESAGGEQGPAEEAEGGDEQVKENKGQKRKPGGRCSTKNKKQRMGTEAMRETGSRKHRIHRRQDDKIHAGGSNQFTGHSQTAPTVSPNAHRGPCEYTCQRIPVSFEF